ncbi:hypothetical protein I2486_09775 [Cellulophaga sp. E16_2]|uniref:Outer membrane protein beta-barrel domain-containing protein n=1 Tax=Cellulophaga algicola (strain DSM 14237 / IC166 / ACAM 630) TaxID=688270 RepID=E6XF07_CELAD|nr:MULTISPECIES: hypothetical protein [Cellulophaga]ADV49229.1 hypothetical protein Celal_1930 [Cellulophaga algicola DSM 14237]MBO0591695.1 hypothetical protein [Cellulophaga sp. E16_2]
MKNLFLLAAFVCFGTMYSQQGLKFGIQGGLAVNEFADATSVILGADFGHMWAVNETIDLGVMTGYIHGFAEKYGTEDVLIDLPTIQFLPIAASLRIWGSNSFSFGADIGTALGLNEGNDGGFYYRPQIGFLMGPYTEFNISYTGIQLDDASWNTVTIGIVYTLELKQPY